jgi:hypothetical protein
MTQARNVRIELVDATAAARNSGINRFASMSCALPRPEVTTFASCG